MRVFILLICLFQISTVYSIGTILGEVSSYYEFDLSSNSQNTVITINLLSQTLGETGGLHIGTHLENPLGIYRENGMASQVVGMSKDIYVANSFFEQYLQSVDGTQLNMEGIDINWQMMSLLFLRYQLFFNPGFESTHFTTSVYRTDKGEVDYFTIIYGDPQGVHYQVQNYKDSWNDQRKIDFGLKVGGLFHGRETWVARLSKKGRCKPSADDQSYPPGGGGGDDNNFLSKILDWLLCRHCCQDDGEDSDPREFEKSNYHTFQSPQDVLLNHLITTGVGNYQVSQ